jgi:hypothetical protein
MELDTWMLKAVSAPGLISKQVSASMADKGPGSHIDVLNHCMQDWNWKKTIGMGKLIFHS